jgi:hypothetical protein
MASNPDEHDPDTILYLIPRTELAQRAISDPANRRHVVEQTFPRYQIPDEKFPSSDDQISTQPNSPIKQDVPIEIIRWGLDSPWKDTGGVFTFGRGWDPRRRPVDIRLNGDTRISSCHFKLSLDTVNLRIMVTNESLNGMSMNTEAIWDKDRAVFHGALLECGNVSFEVSIPCRTPFRKAFRERIFGVNSWFRAPNSLEDGGPASPASSASSGLFGNGIIEESSNQRQESHKISNDVLPSKSIISVQLDGHFGVEGGYGKGGLFEGLAKPKPRATEGKGRNSRKPKDAPLPLKIGPAPEKTWPYIKMGGLFNSSDME